MIHKIIIAGVFALLAASTTQAQIGINTLTPAAALDIKGATTGNQKTVQILNAANRNIFTIQDDGRLGMGVVSPLVGFDLRGTSTDPIVAIGTTNKTAAEVAGGAIRYMEGTKELHYSDNVEWFRLEADLTRPCVVAPNDSIAGVYPDNTTTRLTGYVSSYDSHNTFDQATSVYTAPVDGMYVLSFTVTFKSSAVVGNSYILGSWVASNGQTLRCVQAYPVGGFGMTGLTCTGTLQLALGDTVYPEVWHNLGQSKEMRVYGTISDLGFNWLSIYSQ